MLRANPESMHLAETASSYAMEAGATDSDFPGLETAFAVADEPALGILFYRAKQSFYLPYHLLQAMRYEADQLTLVFAVQDVVIHGRGLHQLYRQLATHRVWRIIEQGERYAAASTVLVHVNQVTEIPKGDEA